MRAIRKGREPPSLATHRQTPLGDYDNYEQKDELRDALVREQQGLCCYCMGQITANGRSMKIEHWRCQSRHPDEQLVYRNLLGACMGGYDQPEHLQHCDTRKGDADLRWNPADPAHRIEQRIRYGMDGTIASDDVEFNGQLNDVLGLNLSHLKNSRRAVLAGFIDWWKREKARLQGPVPRERLERERARRAASGGTLAPFEPIVVWWLDQRLRRTEF